MVLGARLRTVMSSIIRWRKAETLPAGGIEYADGLLLLIASKSMETVPNAKSATLPPAEIRSAYEWQVVATEVSRAG
jgi:hypothetical protein